MAMVACKTKKNKKNIIISGDGGLGAISDTRTTLKQTMNFRLETSATFTWAQQ
jgi:hypothetical protein